MNIPFSLLVIGLAATVPVGGASLEDFASCGDCLCIPEGEACPTNSMPVYEWSDDHINNLLGVTLEIPITQPCDPYNNVSCDTVPPLEVGGVCAYEITASGQTCQGEYSYRYVSVIDKPIDVIIAYLKLSIKQSCDR